ncbi:MAG: T9SS type A sorting domain-containing protein [Saprospiraceae bacterium]
MKPLTLIIRLFFLLTVCPVVGQTEAFLYENNVEGLPQYIPSGTQLEDGSYLLVSRRYLGDSVQCGITRIDQSGEILQQHVVSEKTRLLINTVYDSPQGILLIGTSSTDSSGFFTTILLNSDLTINDVNSVPMDYLEQSGAYILDQDSFLTVSITTTDGDIFGPLFSGHVAKVTYNGDIVDLKLNIVNDLITNFLFDVESSQYWCMGFNRKFYVFDSEFNSIDTLITPFQLVQEGSLLQATDSSFILVGKRHNNIFFPPYEETDNIGVGLVSNSLEEISLLQVGMEGDTLDVPAFNVAAVHSSDGNIYIGGNSNSQQGYWLYGPEPSWFTLAKIDKETFEPLWVKYYGGDEIYNMFGLTPTSDGGVLMYGSKYYYDSSQEVHDIAIKVDKDGVTNTSEIPVSLLPVLLYPNPFTRHIQITADWGLHNDLSIQFFDSQGLQVFSSNLNPSLKDQIVPMPNLPNGNYFFSIYSGENWISSGQLVRME